MCFGSVARLDTTICKTSFHSVICMAKRARQTQSCVLIGFGPDPKAERSASRVSLNDVKDSRGNWCKSNVIWQC